MLIIPQGICVINLWCWYNKCNASNYAGSTSGANVLESTAENTQFLHIAKLVPLGNLENSARKQNLQSVVQFLTINEQI